MIINMPILVLLQLSTPDDYRGRVMSLVETGASAMQPLGFLLFGFTLEVLPVWILLSICALCIMTLTIVMWKDTTFMGYINNEKRNELSI